MKKYHLSPLLLVLLLAALSPSCVKKGETSSAKLVNATTISDADYPEVVALFRSATDFDCTGTYVKEDTVLTAAHCTLGLTALYMPDPENRTGPMLTSTRFIIHEKWQGTGSPYDLALIQFPARAKARIAVFADRPLVKGDKITLVGYGSTRVPVSGERFAGSDGKTKTKGDNVVVDFKAGYIHFVGPTEGGFGDLTGSSKGDSGGPLFMDGNKLAGVTFGGSHRYEADQSTIDNYYTNLTSQGARDFLTKNDLVVPAIAMGECPDGAGGVGRGFGGIYDCNVGKCAKTDELYDTECFVR